MTRDEGGTQSAEPVILVVGNPDRWSSAGKRLSGASGFVFAEYADLTAGYVMAIGPDIVLSALFGETFDAMDLARRLAELGFTGRYRALGESLPDSAMVLREVRSAAPGLDFDILSATELFAAMKLAADRSDGRGDG